MKTKRWTEIDIGLLNRFAFGSRFAFKWDCELHQQVGAIAMANETETSAMMSFLFETNLIDFACFAEITVISYKFIQ